MFYIRDIEMTREANDNVLIFPILDETERKKKLKGLYWDMVDSSYDTRRYDDMMDAIADFTEDLFSIIGMDEEPMNNYIIACELQTMYGWLLTLPDLEDCEKKEPLFITGFGR